MKHAYFLIFVVQLVSAFPNLISEEGSTEIKYFSCNDIYDCIKIDENMHCFIDKVYILRILSYFISYFKQKFCLFLAQTRSSCSCSCSCSCKDGFSWNLHFCEQSPHFEFQNQTGSTFKQKVKGVAIYTFIIIGIIVLVIIAIICLALCCMG